MKPKHTPGPWKAFDVPSGPFSLSSIEGDIMTIRGGMKPTKHDAALIAAAPELLALAKEILAWARGGESDFSAFDDLETAIAKAEGRGE